MGTKNKTKSNQERLQEMFGRVRGALKGGAAYTHICGHGEVPWLLVYMRESEKPEKEHRQRFVINRLKQRQNFKTLSTISIVHP